MWIGRLSWILKYGFVVINIFVSVWRWLDGSKPGAYGLRYPALCPYLYAIPIVLAEKGKEIIISTILLFPFFFSLNVNFLWTIYAGKPDLHFAGENGALLWPIEGSILNQST